MIHEMSMEWIYKIKLGISTCCFFYKHTSFSFSEINLKKIVQFQFLQLKKKTTKLTVLRDLDFLSFTLLAL